MYSPSWRRSDYDEANPKIWSSFEREYANGEHLHFQIQDLTSEYYDEAFEIVEKYFLPQETFHATAGVVNPSAHVTFIKGLAERIILPQRISLVCLLKDMKEEAGKPRVVGYNFLGVAKKGEELDLKEWKQHETGSRFLEILQAVKKLGPDMMTKYNADEYIGSLGLCIHPHFRGMRIAEEILKARYSLCQSLGIKLTYSTFTAKASQHIALKCGFVEETCISYEEVQKSMKFTFVTNQTHCKVMSKVIS